MVRKGLNTVYLTDKEAEVIDRYIQLNFMKLKKKRKANRSAIVREIVNSWAKEKRLEKAPL